MAELKQTASTNGEGSGEDIASLRRHLKDLQKHQSRLTKQVDKLTRILSTLLDAQTRANKGSSTLGEQCLIECSTESCNMPAEEPESGADVRSTTAPYPRFNAGHRLSSVSELPEIIILELPSEDILFAQRVNRQFRRVIAQSPQIQQRLFLAALPTDAALASVILNPIITKKQTLPHVPLYFDKHSTTMAYYQRGTRKRVYCTSAAVVRDETTGNEWIELRLTDFFVPTTNFLFSEPRQAPFGAGSWKHMCLSQPPCEVRWHLRMIDESDRRLEHIFSGTA